MEMFCKNLRNLAMKIINYEKKEMILLINKETEFYEKQKVCYVCEKEFSIGKKYHKVRGHSHYTEKFRGATHNSLNLRYKILKEIPIVLHDGSVYDYHFIIEQLPIEFKGKIDYSGENTEKYITFSAPIYEKYDNDETITYKLNFMDSFRFMSTSLSSLADNLSEIYEKECELCKEKKSYQNVDSLILRIMNYITSVKNVMMNHINQ